MRAWCVPCWSGDFRVEANKDDKESCVLTVEDPTPTDKERLTPFLVAARERGWIPLESGIQPTGKTVLPVKAPIHLVAPLLVDKVVAAGTVWTAVRSKDGSITVEDGTTIKEPEKADVAVTISEPRLGCPAPEPCVRRASEVLRSFCTKQQWDEFQAYGYLRATGNLSGRRYRVYHRDEAARRGLAHALIDAETGKDICIYDPSIPAEEEVLSLKLAVEHREGLFSKQAAYRIGIA